MMWSEPKGENGTIITGPMGNAKFGEAAYQSIRRFIIVRVDLPGCSICV